ncbi:hypothetical protein P7K49_020572 [Saguinus oedipus]|uniref:Uncharacterized protein n=1 Tax=Saguinus oedipus TaxID=9490 RepID=A0ABQ9V0U4_SAGOE|nr:hypothetical protein P7K49_020572 [Saguinus oedipus]
MDQAGNSFPDSRTFPVDDQPIFGPEKKWLPFQPVTHMLMTVVPVVRNQLSFISSFDSGLWAKNKEKAADTETAEQYC